MHSTSLRRWPVFSSWILAASLALTGALTQAAPRPAGAEVGAATAKLAKVAQKRKPVAKARKVAPLARKLAPAILPVAPVLVQAEPAPLALKPASALAAEPASPPVVPAEAGPESRAAMAAPVPGNPYLVGAPSLPPSPVQSVAAGGRSGFGLSLPHIPLFEQAILPRVKTVYPTGEKPLVVVTFKCPTELVGIDTPSTVILHKVVNGGMSLINKTDLLAFNMQQVCQ